jgi:hypothetical protein
MKALNCYLLGIAWACCWFLGCGGSASSTTSVSVTATQTQGGSDSSSSAESDPCLDCLGTASEVAACLAVSGVVPDDCTTP